MSKNKKKTKKRKKNLGQRYSKAEVRQYKSAGILP